MKFYEDFAIPQDLRELTFKPRFVLIYGRRSEFENNKILKQKRERAPQLLFYGVAEAYCEANNLSLDRETNAGIGSLDFKLSRGFDAKVNVELKYSTNSNLVKGFEKQLPAYNRAEKTNHSIYLIILTKKNQRRLNTLLKLADRQRADNKRVPEIIVIDGRKQLSASLRN